MTNTELILSMLAEDSTKDISQAVNPKDFDQSKKMPNKVVVLPDMHAKNWNQQQGKK